MITNITLELEWQDLCVYLNKIKIMRSLLFILLVNVLTSCNNSDDVNLNGKWQRIEDSDRIEEYWKFRNGELEIERIDLSVNESVYFNEQYVVEGGQLLMGGQEYQIEISKKELTLYNNQVTLLFKK